MENALIHPFFLNYDSNFSFTKNHLIQNHQNNFMTIFITNNQIFYNYATKVTFFQIKQSFSHQTHLHRAMQETCF